MFLAFHQVQVYLISDLINSTVPQCETAASHFLETFWRTETSACAGTFCNLNHNPETCVGFCLSLFIKTVPRCLWWTRIYRLYRSWQICCTTLPPGGRGGSNPGSSACKFRRRLDLIPTSLTVTGMKDVVFAFVHKNLVLVVIMFKSQSPRLNKSLMVLKTRDWFMTRGGRVISALLFLKSPSRGRCIFISFHQPLSKNQEMKWEWFIPFGKVWGAWVSSSHSEDLNPTLERTKITPCVLSIKSFSAEAKLGFCKTQHAMRFICIIFIQVLEKKMCFTACKSKSYKLTLLMLMFRWIVCLH